MIYVALLYADFITALPRGFACTVSSIYILLQECINFHEEYPFVTM